MLVESKVTRTHAEHLHETFNTLRKYQIKLNPTKCTFGGSQIIFGFHGLQHGVEANSEKIKAICYMSPSNIVKDVQHLTGRIVAINQFVSNLIEYCIPLFQTLKYLKDFRCTEEYQKAFDDLRSYLTSLPLLGRPDPFKKLFLYLAVSPSIMSAMLIKEKDRIQKPIYYISRILRVVETRYSKLEKLVYALLIAVRKLHPYFQAHTIILLIDQPMKNIFHWLDALWACHQKNDQAFRV